jgi:predicted transglutaminase-like cysteine proteinase
MRKAIAVDSTFARAVLANVGADSTQIDRAAFLQRSHALITAFLLIVLAALGGGTGACAYASAASVAIATTHDQAQDQAEAQENDDTKTPEKVAALDPAEPFGLNAVPVAAGELLTKWTNVEADIRAENDILARCRDSAALCPSAARHFLAIIADGRAHTGRARIGVVNRAINLAIRPMSDLAQRGVPDRWSAPLETLTTGRGDSEEYAIAKYVALRAAGIAEDDIRLVIVRDLAVNEDHAIVVARLDGSWIVLDNRWLALAEDFQMRHVIPLFVLDHDGVKQFARTATAGARSRDYHQL